MDEDAGPRVAALQRAQGGAVHVRQARHAGMTDRQIEGRLATGAWSEPHPGVYVASGAPDTFDARCFAALLAVRYLGHCGAPRRVALAGMCAAYAYDLRVPDPGRVTLVVPMGDSAPRLAGVVVVRARTWPRRLFSVRGGLVVTGVADTIVDIAPLVTPDDLLAILQDAAFTRPGLPHAVLAACRRGRTGSAAARRAAALLLAGTDSSLHGRGHAAAADAGLPAPVCGAEVVPGAGPSDCAFVVPGAAGPPFGLVVEWDGDAHRVERRTFLHDREKDRLLRRAGYVVVRYTAEQLGRPGVVAADLRAEWARVAASGPLTRRSHAS